MKNAVLIKNFYKVITGSTFNAFEYFYTAWLHNKNMYLIYVDGVQHDNVDHFCKIYEEPYYFINQYIPNHIKTYKSTESFNMNIGFNTSTYNSDCYCD